MHSVVLHALCFRKIFRILSVKTGFKHHFPKILVHKPADPIYGLLASPEMHAPASLLFDTTHHFLNLRHVVQACFCRLSCTCIAEVTRLSAVNANLGLGIGKK